MLIKLRHNIQCDNTNNNKFIYVALLKNRADCALSGSTAQEYSRDEIEESQNKVQTMKKTDATCRKPIYKINKSKEQQQQQDCKTDGKRQEYK